MFAGGIEFWPQRQLLDKRSSINDVLKDASTVYAFSVLGVTLVSILKNPETRIKKLLLPDPNSGSLKNLEVTTTNSGYKNQIENMTEVALSKGIETRIYKEFIGYSLLIVDPDEPNGWLRVEWVLPYSDHTERPNIKIQKNKQPKAFAHFLKTFNAMWDKAEKPNLNSDDQSNLISTPETSIKFIPGRLISHAEYMETNNISSVTDDGVGKFTITFEKPIDPNFTTSVEGDKNIEFQVLSKTKSSAKIHFYGDEPEIVKLVFR